MDFTREMTDKIQALGILLKDFRERISSGKRVLIENISYITIISQIIQGYQ